MRVLRNAFEQQKLKERRQRAHKTPISDVLTNQRLLTIFH